MLSCIDDIMVDVGSPTPGARHQELCYILFIAHAYYGYIASSEKLLLSEFNFWLSSSQVKSKLMI